jgi:hypothetical protein
MFSGRFGGGLPHEISPNPDEAMNPELMVARRENSPGKPRRHQRTVTTRSQLSVSSLGSRRQHLGQPRRPASLKSPEDHPEFMQYLEEVVKGIKSSKELEEIAEHKVGLALENLSEEQQSAVTALQYLYMEVQISSKLSNDRAAQY